MKNIMIISLCIFLIGCKESAERSIVINAPINEVWSVVSDLGEHADFITSIDSTTLSPKGEATIGAEWIVYGKYEYYAKNEIIAVEPMKRIETKLIMNQAIKGIKIKELSLMDNHYFVDLFITIDLLQTNK